MTPDDMPGEGSRFAADGFRSHWLLFALVGGLFIVAGLVAVIASAFAWIAPNEAVGLVLMLVGLAQIVQAAKMHEDSLSTWCFSLGCVAVVGGLLVHLEPFPAVVAKTLVMAGVFVLHGVAQIAFAIRVRALRGGVWFAVGGGVAMLAGVLLAMKLPYGPSFTPATIGGISLAFGGVAYLAVAMVARRS